MPRRVAALSSRQLRAAPQTHVAAQAHQSGSADALHFITTVSGIRVDTREDIWYLDGKEGTNVGVARRAVHATLIDGLDGTLRYFARRTAPGSLANFVYVVSHYRQTMFGKRSIKCWKLLDLQNYRMLLGDEFGNENYLIKLRSFLKKWSANRYPGVDTALCAGLSKMRLRNSGTGRAVRTMDPHKGPLTDEELHNLKLDALQAAESRRINLEELSICLFHIAHGRRPVQSANIKCKDVRSVCHPDAAEYPRQQEQTATVNIPRAKQSGSGFRNEMREVDVEPALFALLDALRESVSAEFQRLLHDRSLVIEPDLLRAILDELPLYPAWTIVAASLDEVAEISDTGQRTIAIKGLGVHARGRLWHTIADIQLNALKRVAAISGATSRTGEPLRLTATRLRYTKGTGLARLGVGIETIAWLLDHSTTESGGIYIDTLPEHAATIDAALNGSVTMKVIAQMFRGQLVDSESEALNGDSPGQSRIDFQGKGAATCGILKRCGMGDGIPIICYTCDKFQPWLDGPHESVLHFLLRERREESIALGPTHPIVRRRDKSIVAVINVLQRCEMRRAELVKKSGGGGS